MSSAAERPLRLFFALWPDDRVRIALAAAAGALRKACDGRTTPAENLHMTLAFIGDVPAGRLPELQHIAAGLGAASFALTLDCIGWWRTQRLVWAGTTACPHDLASLVDRLAARLHADGFRTERRGFKPHVTLLRDARTTPARENIEPLRWHAEDFVLACSEPAVRGVRYRIVGKWPLQHSAGL